MQSKEGEVISIWTGHGISRDTHVFVADTEHEVTALEVDFGEARPEMKINVSD